MRPAPSPLVFYLTAAGFTAFGVAGAVGAILVPTIFPDHVSRQFAFFGGVAMLLTAGFTCVWPTMHRYQAEALIDLPVALNDVQARLTDLHTVRREHKKAADMIDGAATVLDQARTALADLSKEMAATLVQRAQLEQQLTEKRQEVERGHKETARWRAGVVLFVEALERALDPSHPLPPEYRKAYEKATRDFLGCVGPLGLEVIRPNPNDPLDERIHQVEADELTEAVEPGHVVRCTGWGYRTGGTVERHATVVLAKPRPAPAAPAAPAPEVSVTVQPQP